MGDTQAGRDGLFLAPPSTEVTEPEPEGAARNVGESAMRRLRHPFTDGEAGNAEPPAEPSTERPTERPAEPPAEREPPD
jgi:hypothetical protein